MYSEKLLDIDLDNAHVRRVCNQFANSFDDYNTAENLGMGSAPITMTPVNKRRD